MRKSKFLNFPAQLPIVFFMILAFLVLVGFGSYYFVDMFGDYLWMCICVLAFINTLTLLFCFFSFYIVYRTIAIVSIKDDMIKFRRFSRKETLRTFNAAAIMYIFKASLPQKIRLIRKDYGPLYIVFEEKNTIKRRNYFPNPYVTLDIADSKKNRELLRQLRPDIEITPIKTNIDTLFYL